MTKMGQTAKPNTAETIRLRISIVVVAAHVMSPPPKRFRSSHSRLLHFQSFQNGPQRLESRALASKRPIISFLPYTCSSPYPLRSPSPRFSWFLPWLILPFRSMGLGDRGYPGNWGPSHSDGHQVFRQHSKRVRNFPVNCSVASVALFNFRITPSFITGASTVLSATWMYNRPATQPRRHLRLRPIP